MEHYCLMGSGLLFFVWNDGKVLEIGSGDGYTELLMYFMPLTCTLKNG